MKTYVTEILVSEHHAALRREAAQERLARAARPEPEPRRPLGTRVGLAAILRLARVTLAP